MWHCLEDDALLLWPGPCEYTADLRCWSHGDSNERHQLIVWLINYHFTPPCALSLQLKNRIVSIPCLVYLACLPVFNLHLNMLWNSGVHLLLFWCCAEWEECVIWYFVEYTQGLSCSFSLLNLNPRLHVPLSISVTFSNKLLSSSFYFPICLSLSLLGHASSRVWIGASVLQSFP